MNFYSTATSARPVRKLAVFSTLNRERERERDRYRKVPLTELAANECQSTNDLRALFN